MSGLLDAVDTGIVVKFGSDITGLIKGTTDATKALGDFGSSSEKSTASYTKLGVVAGGVATGVGLAIVGLTDSAKKTNAELADTAITVGTTTESMRDLALATSDAGFPLDDTISTFNLLSRAGLEDEEAISNVAKTMDELGDATGNSAATVTSALIPALNAFDIPLVEVSDHVDGLTYLTKNSTIDLTDFTSTISSLGPKLDNLGLSLEDTEAIMLALADKGYQGTAATKYLRTAVTDAAKAAKDYQDDLDDLTKASSKLKDEQEKLTDKQKDLLKTQKELATSTRDTSLSLEENALDLADAKDELAKMKAAGKDADETTAEYNRKIQEQELRIKSLGYAHDDLIAKQAELKTSTTENVQAQKDNAAAIVKNSNAISDNTTKQTALNEKINSSEQETLDFYATLGLTKEEIAAYKEKIDGATGSTKQYAEAADSAIGTTDKVKSAWDEMTLSIGTSLEPLSGVGTALSVGGPLLIGLTQLPELIGSVSTAMTFLAANPIVLIIAAVALLVLGLYELEVKFHWIETVTAAFGAGWAILWTGMVSAVQGASNLITSIIDELVNGIKWGINLVVDGINLLIGGINTVSSVGGLLGNRFAIPKIPRLASGGIVTQPTVAMIGEAGPEAVVPLSRAGGAGTGGIIITGNTFTVRNDNDIKLIAQELQTQITRENRTRGVQS